MGKGHRALLHRLGGQEVLQIPQILLAVGEGPPGLLPLLRRLGRGLGGGCLALSLAPAAFPAGGWVRRGIQRLGSLFRSLLGGLLPLGRVLFPGGLAGLSVLGIDHPALGVLHGDLKDLHGIVMRPPGDGLFQQLLNVLEHGHLPIVTEGDGGAPPARPARAADAVDIGLRHLGEVVVEHIGELLNVQAPGGDVRGHQDPELSLLKLPQALLPGGLGLVAVDGRRGHPPPGQVPGHFVRPVLGPGEHQGAFHLLLLQNLQQQGGFVLPIHQADLLADDLHRGGHRGGGHLHRVMEEGVHQV